MRVLKVLVTALLVVAGGIRAVSGQERSAGLFEMLKSGGSGETDSWLFSKAMEDEARIFRLWVEDRDRKGYNVLTANWLRTVMQMAGRGNKDIMRTYQRYARTADKKRLEKLTKAVQFLDCELSSIGLKLDINEVLDRGTNPDEVRRREIIKKVRARQSEQQSETADKTPGVNASGTGKAAAKGGK